MIYLSSKEYFQFRYVRVHSTLGYKDITLIELFLLYIVCT